MSHKGFRLCPYYTIWAHIRDPGSPERCGCENGFQYAGTLRRRLHPPHLRPRHQTATEQSSGDNGKFYGTGHVNPPQKAQKYQAGKRNFLSGILCPSPNISPCRLRCGSMENRKNKLAERVAKAREIPPESVDSSGILELLPRFELGVSTN